MNQFLVILFLLFCQVTWANEEALLKNLENSLALKARLSSISEDYVLVQAWSPFCDICGTEVNELNNLTKILDVNSPGKLNVIGVPIQSRKREIEAFVEHFKPKYSQWEPSPDVKSFLEKQGVLPLTFLFDSKRKLIKEWIGKVSASEILKVVKPIKIKSFKRRADS